MRAVLYIVFLTMPRLLACEVVACCADGTPIDKGDPNVVDDRDGINEEEEYEQWRLRELKRIRRQQEEIEQCVPGIPAHA